MALIKCPECGKENVSDSAVSCPECGFSIKEHFDKIKLEELRIKEQKEYQEKQAAEERIRRETAPERQKDTITRLEKQIEKSQKELIKGVIGLAISLPLFILFWCLSSHGSLGILIVISGFAVVGSGIFVVGSITEKNTAVRDLEIAKRDFDEYEKESAQKSQAYAAQARIYAAQTINFLFVIPELCCIGYGLYVLISKKIVSFSDNKLLILISFLAGVATVILKMFQFKRYFGTGLFEIKRFLIQRILLFIPTGVLVAFIIIFAYYLFSLKNKNN